MDPTRNTHVKLLAADFISLAVSSSAPPTISRRGRPVFRAESVGIVVSRDRRPKLLRFLIDDGSGCVPCVLWLNHHLLPQTSDFASGDDLAASAATDHAGNVHLGELGVTSYDYVGVTTGKKHAATSGKTRGGSNKGKYNNSRWDACNCNKWEEQMQQQMSCMHNNERDLCSGKK